MTCYSGRQNGTLLMSILIEKYLSYHISVTQCINQTSIYHFSTEYLKNLKLFSKLIDLDVTYHWGIHTRINYAKNVVILFYGCLHGGRRQSRGTALQRIIVK